MRTSAVSDNVLFIALTTHILHSYRRSLTMCDPTLYAPYTPTSPYTPGDHAAAAALLRTCHIQDVLADDFDVLARDILPPDYASRLRGAARGSGAGYIPLSGEDAMSVQVYGAYRRAKKELLECVAGVVDGVVRAWQGTREERELLRGRLTARGAVDGQREVMQGEMDAMVVAYRGVGRLGWDERRGRVVFLEARGGRWVEMFA
ncbi:hypothetical protein P167DRAFT_575977 [Morchella conica CCBAS932]|uniref:Uncharacterized protein n=1 Tax=Morchella conica CCBAS932 TaxID=1392247 RepID=A0A3N4KQK3_9PEZI|nr:hypothetical protein P167DRAFT_575977 [Morchella conica CCBAS932]